MRGRPRTGTMKSTSRPVLIMGTPGYDFFWILPYPVIHIPGSASKRQEFFPDAIIFPYSLMLPARTTSGGVGSAFTCPSLPVLKPM
jgi:hypothetical protein